MGKRGNVVAHIIQEEFPKVNHPRWVTSQEAGRLFKTSGASFRGAAYKRLVPSKVERVEGRSRLLVWIGDPKKATNPTGPKPILRRRRKATSNLVTILKAALAEAMRVSKRLDLLDKLIESHNGRSPKDAP